MNTDALSAGPTPRAPHCHFCRRPITGTAVAMYPGDPYTELVDDSHDACMDYLAAADAAVGGVTR